MLREPQSPRGSRAHQAHGHYFRFISDFFRDFWRASILTNSENVLTISENESTVLTNSENVLTISENESTVLTNNEKFFLLVRTLGLQGSPCSVSPRAPEVPGLTRLTAMLGEP